MLRVVKVHSPQQLEGIEAALRSRRAVYIYSYRDIRDVVVSIQQKWKPSFSQVLRACYIEYILDAYADWMALPGGHVSRYEWFVEEPRAEARAIAAHLGLSFTDQELDVVVERHTLEAQKARMVSLRDAGLQTSMDGVFHSDHVFSGATGQWRKHLKSYQVGYLEHRAYDWLVDHGYEISQTRFWRYLGILYFWYCFRIAGPRMEKPPRLF